MEFLIIASAHFLALLSPGPDFFLILQASLRLPRRYGLAICTGIGAANGVYLVLAVLGLEIIRESQWLLLTLKYVGGLYLVFIGVMLLASTRRIRMDDEAQVIEESRNACSYFMMGFLSALLNPKNGLFYLSLFTVMVAESTSLGVRCLYALWMVAVVVVWDSMVVMITASRTVRDRLGEAVYMLEKIAGITLAGFGIMLPLHLSEEVHLKRLLVIRENCREKMTAVSDAA